MTKLFDGSIVNDRDTLLAELPADLILAFMVWLVPKSIVCVPELPFNTKPLPLAKVNVKLLLLVAMFP
jgi:hypothetical protein